MLPAAEEHRGCEFLSGNLPRGCEVRDPRLHRFVFYLEVHESRAPGGGHGLCQMLLVSSCRGGIELTIVDGQTGGLQLVSVATHGGKKQHDLLLMVPLVGTQTHVLSHEHRFWLKRLYMRDRKELVA